MDPLPDDRRRFEAARASDPEAVDALVAEFLPVVLGWCTRLGGPGVDPEDAASDVFLVVLSRLHRVRVAEAFPSWLLAVTRRTLANHRRRAWLRRWLPGAPWDVEDPHSAADADDLHRHVQALLERLSRDHREILVLCDVEERTAPEVAVLLGIPEGTVASRLRAARARMRVLESRGSRIVTKAAPRVERP